MTACGGRPRILRDTVRLFGREAGSGGAAVAAQRLILAWRQLVLPQASPVPGQAESTLVEPGVVVSRASEIYVQAREEPAVTAGVLRRH